MQIIDLSIISFLQDHKYQYRGAAKLFRYGTTIKYFNVVKSVILNRLSDSELLSMFLVEKYEKHILRHYMLQIGVSFDDL